MNRAARQAFRAIPKARDLNALIWAPEEQPVSSCGDASSHAPLDDIAIVVKDNIQVRGLPTTAGSPALADDVATDHAPVVRLLLDAGAHLMGKTNLDELAFGGTSHNPTFGTVLNPFNPAYTAGGSSGGSAAAVAIGMVALAIGTDTAGSSRVPAACTGIVGFRPTLNRYPLDRVVPISFNRDVVGLLAKDVETATRADQILSGAGGNELGSKELRLAIPIGLAESGVSARVRRVFSNACMTLQSAGIELIECDLPASPDQLSAAHLAIINYDMPRHLSVYLRRSGCGRSLDDVITRISDPVVKFRLAEMAAADPTLAYRTQQDALAEADRYRDFLQDLFERHRPDALFYPTTAVTAAHSDRPTVDIDGQARPASPTMLRNTLLATLANLPSLSLPIGIAEDGIPVGALIEGPPNSDGRLLAIGAKLETIITNAIGRIQP